MNTPKNHPEFNQRWQALMRQLETTLSLAHHTTVNETAWLESASMAKHFIDRVIQCGGVSLPQPITPKAAATADALEALLGRVCTAARALQSAGHASFAREWFYDGILDTAQEALDAFRKG
jgi:hypothetical protein